MSDHVCAGECAPRHTRPRHCLGLCAPPSGRPPPAAATAKWPCAAPRVSRVRPPSPHGPAYSVCRAGGLAHSIRSLGALALGPQPSPPRRHILFPRASRSAPEERSGAGAESGPARAVGEGGRAAGRPPPLPCRPRPGALMGFSMTASGRGPPLFPWSPAAARLPRRAPGFFQGSTGAWRCRLLHFPTQTPASCARARAATPARPRDHLRGAVPSPDARLAPSLRALSPTCARKVDRLRARTPPRLAPRAPPGLQVGGRGSGGCGAGPPMPPGCGRASRFPQGVGVQSGR